MRRGIRELLATSPPFRRTRHSFRVISLPGFNKRSPRPGQIAVATSAGIMHPVFALWPVVLADALEHWLLTNGKRRVRGFIESHPFEKAEFPLIETEDGPIDPFFNINTKADLETAQRWLPLIEGLER